MLDMLNTIYMLHPLKQMDFFRTAFALTPRDLLNSSAAKNTKNEFEAV